MSHVLFEDQFIEKVKKSKAEPSPDSNTVTIPEDNDVKPLDDCRKSSASINAVSKPVNKVRTVFQNF